MGCLYTVPSSGQKTEAMVFCQSAKVSLHTTPVWIPSRSTGAVCQLWKRQHVSHWWFRVTQVLGSTAWSDFSQWFSEAEVLATEHCPGASTQGNMQIRGSPANTQKSLQTLALHWSNADKKQDGNKARDRKPGILFLQYSIKSGSVKVLELKPPHISSGQEG